MRKSKNAEAADSKGSQTERSRGVIAPAPDAKTSVDAGAARRSAQRLN